jgi:hypothetical protein
MQRRTIMPLLLSILLFNLLYADEAPRRILMSGYAHHEQPITDDGVKLRKFIPGIGYERDYFKEYGTIYYTYHAMLLRDSLENPQIYFAGSQSLRFNHGNFDTSVGLAGFVSIKKMRDIYGSYSYEPVAGLAPIASLYKDDVTFNIAYIPSVQYDDYDIIGFLYLYLGFRF